VERHANEAFEERAAIAEFCGGLTREEAEHIARVELREVREPKKESKGESNEQDRN
jgi:acyl-CoA reductase-like NAD-dependent aldehyde dehydrogenase